MRKMREEVRSSVHGGRFTVGVAADLNRDLPIWKRDADFIFTQISFDPGRSAGGVTWASTDPSTRAWSY